MTRTATMARNMSDDDMDDGWGAAGLGHSRLTAQDQLDAAKRQLQSASKNTRFKELTLLSDSLSDEEYVVNDQL